MPQFWEDCEYEIDTNDFSALDWDIHVDEFKVALNCAVGAKDELFNEGYKGFARFVYKKNLFK